MNGTTGDRPRLFRYDMEPGLVNMICHATNGNYALGNEDFAAQVTAAFGRRAVPVKSGRPRRMQAPDSEELFGEYGKPWSVPCCFLSPVVSLKCLQVSPKPQLPQA